MELKHWFKQDYCCYSNSGSIRDKEIIKFANQTGTILVFSNTRHFKH